MSLSSSIQRKRLIRQDATPEMKAMFASMEAAGKLNRPASHGSMHPATMHPPTHSSMHSSTMHAMTPHPPPQGGHPTVKKGIKGAGHLAHAHHLSHHTSMRHHAAMHRMASRHASHRASRAHHAFHRSLAAHRKPVGIHRAVRRTGARHNTPLHHAAAHHAAARHTAHVKGLTHKGAHKVKGAHKKKGIHKIAMRKGKQVKPKKGHLSKGRQHAAGRHTPLAHNVKKVSAKKQLHVTYNHKLANPPGTGIGINRRGAYRFAGRMVPKGIHNKGFKGDQKPVMGKASRGKKH